MKINNRRYIGSKTKLLDNIGEVLDKYPPSRFPILLDAFGGTGVVTDFANKKGYKTIINDILFSNFVSYKTWFSDQEVDMVKLEDKINYYNKLNIYPDHSYLGEIYGDKYFTMDVANKIDFIREDIESYRMEINDREYYYLLTSLMYAADKVANTVGHFEHYLTHGHDKKKFEMQVLELDMFVAKIYCEDINSLVENEKLKCNILYLDPPYNARQYVNFYHVLENIARWDKPTEFEGKSMKFKRNHLKSEYSRSKAINYFSHLIETIDTEVIILSYNNTYNARSGASNNKMSEEEIISTLSNYGSVEIIDINYKAFQAGKTNLNNHVEKIFICEVLSSK